MPAHDFKLALTRVTEPTGGPGAEFATLEDAAPPALWPRGPATEATDVPFFLGVWAPPPGLTAPFAWSGRGSFFVEWRRFSPTRRLRHPSSESMPMSIDGGAGWALHQLFAFPARCRASAPQRFDWTLIVRAVSAASAAAIVCSPAVAAAPGSRA